MENREDLVEKVINEGHNIAEKIKDATSVEKLNELEDEIQEYINFVDQNFGSEDEFSDVEEKASELSFYLIMAVEEKARHLECHYENPEEIGNDGVDNFLDFLDAKKWLEKDSAE